MTHTRILFFVLVSSSVLVVPALEAAPVAYPFIECNGLGHKVNGVCSCDWGATQVDGTCQPGFKSACDTGRASLPHSLREERVYRQLAMCGSNGSPSNHRYLFGQHHDHPDDLVGTPGVAGLGGSCNWQKFCRPPYTNAQNCDYFPSAFEPNFWVSGPDAASNVTNIKGSDLGISVDFKGRTFIYFGDTWAHDPDGQYTCDDIAGEPVECNDAIAVLDTCDPDPADGIDMQYIYWSGYYKSFLPLMIDGLHKSTSTNHFQEGFNVPTGAVTYKKGATTYLMVFYATEVLDMDKRSSWAACSSDGVNFNACFKTVAALGSYPSAQALSYGAAGEYSKFINVSPVWITKADMTAISGASDSPFKDLLTRLGGATDGGLLLFGSGAYQRAAGKQTANYRAGRLYLAYIDGKNLPAPHTPSFLAPKVYYYTGGAWSSDQAKAQPIIDRPDFGELSVKLIRNGLPANDPRLVMLYNNGGIRYRTTKLRHAYLAAGSDQTVGWTVEKNARNPAMTTGAHQGYGPYIIDHYTKLSGGKLYLYHTLSSWWGGTSNAPYGVYTAETVLPWP